ncbi:extracellular solute-binding protein [Clostridium botulinum]|uniref:Extracellular solute-binding protein n=1 Tax=Clostridium botulinum TaxID=1491 RepID=A0A846J8A6_CLOBO|nr:extracellular solute-binding protein [Clostridium botulinum]ACA55887.1 hypothetical protein CLK_0711 [Clostridium botulinum A3 str. Loch Maree]NFH66581.1 extracellular solute-binding protein [Clostridium botulinum]NFJ10336.1 extracellular solute-binding protein [Clostridium botulinum]NFK15710.1 extracellular solute-binding protein [Clostridium botulinum]NFM95771.1 extracellular solute-binding protein [Clostridium botulinum]
MKDIIKVLAVNDPAVYAYTKESSVGITKSWEENNEFEIKLNIFKWEEFKENLDKALEDNFGQYDIVMAPSFWIPNIAENNKVIPFNDYIDENYNIEDIFQSVRDEIAYKGKVIAVPSFTDGHIIFYRKDKLNLKGVVTLEELKSVSKDIKGKLALKSSPYEILLDYLPYLWAEGGEIYKDNKLALDSKRASEALCKYTELKEYCIDNVENFGNEEVKSAIQSGEAYIGISWSGQAASIMDNNSFTDKIGFSTYEYPCNTTWTFLVNKHTNKAKVCFDYLKFITNKENDLLSGRISGSPVRSSSYKNEEEIKRNPWYKTNYEMLKRAKRVPALVEWMDISGNFYNSVHKAFTGAISPKEALVNCCIYKK